MYDTVMSAVTGQATDPPVIEVRIQFLTED